MKAPQIEVKLETDESVVYQRVLPDRGRTPKELQEDLKDLPTVTVHTMTMERYEKLKNIERELRDMTSVEKAKGVSLADALRAFFLKSKSANPR